MLLGERRRVHLGGKEVLQLLWVCLRKGRRQLAQVELVRYHNFLRTTFLALLTLALALEVLELLSEHQAGVLLQEVVVVGGVVDQGEQVGLVQLQLLLPNVHHFGVLLDLFVFFVFFVLQLLPHEEVKRLHELQVLAQSAFTQLRRARGSRFRFWRILVTTLGLPTEVTEVFSLFVLGSGFRRGRISLDDKFLAFGFGLADSALAEVELLLNLVLDLVEVERLEAGVFALGYFQVYLFLVLQLEFHLQQRLHL